MENLTVAAIATYAILGVLGFLVLVGALKGLRRGIQRQIVRTVTIIVSIVLSIVAVKIVSGTVLGYFDGKTVEDILNQLVEIGVLTDTSELEFLTNFDTETFKYLLAVPLSLIVMPFVFTIFFVVISFLMLIVHGIISGILGFRKKGNSGLKRLLGMALGAVQGALVTIVILLPILGIADVAGTAVETLRANENKSESEIEIIELYDNNLKEAIESPAVTAMNSLGGRLLFGFVTTAKLDDENVKMTEQVGPVLNVYAEYSANLSEADFMALTEENKAAIKNIIAEIGESNYFSPLLAGIMRGASLTIAENEILTEMEEPLKSVFASVIGIFGTSDKTNIKADLDTFCDLYFLLSDTGLLKAMGGTEGEESGEAPDLMEILAKKDDSGKTALSRAVDILSSNDRTKPIVSTLTKLSITMLGGAMSPDEAGEMDQVYEDVKSGLTEVVQVKRDDYASEEEYKDAVSDKLEEVLVKNNILTESFVTENREDVDDVLSSVTNHITETYGNVEEIGDEEMTGIILEYYEAYVSGNLSDLLGSDVDAPPAE